MAQIKDFVRTYCARTQLSNTLVNQISNDFVLWIGNTLLAGDDVRLPEVGKFKILPNSYSRSGLMKNGASMHYHEFRPSFRFNAAFRKEVDAKAGEIRTGYDKRVDTREAKKARKEEKKRGN